MTDTPEGLFVFPYHMGPAIRKFSVGLIWSGKLIVTLPGWPSGKPPQMFSDIGLHSSKISHPLEKLFATSWHNYNLASKQCIKEIEKLESLGKRLNKVFLLGPGGRQPYDDWLPFHSKCLPAVSKTLENQQILNCACTEFVWRVYELFLELDENPDKVLAYLNTRSTSLGDPYHLLIESSLHHYSIGKVNFPEVITDSVNVLALLSEISSSLEESSENMEVKAGQLAYYLFDSLLKKYIPNLYPENLDKILFILNSKKDSVKAAKAKCFSEANNLLNDNIKSSNKETVTETIKKLKNEVSEIAELDSRAWSGLLQSLSEDRMFWASVVGLIGSMVGPMPSVVPAAAAITAFSSIGTTALKEKRLRRERLQNSPWSLVYYIQNEN